MALTVEDKNEIKEIFQLVSSGTYAKFEEQFSILEYRFDDVDEKLKTIEEQVKLTNGRVNYLEKKDNTATAIRRWVIATFAILGTIGGLIWIGIQIYFKFKT